MSHPTSTTVLRRARRALGDELLKRGAGFLASRYALRGSVPEWLLALGARLVERCDDSQALYEHELRRYAAHHASPQQQRRTEEVIATATPEER